MAFPIAILGLCSSSCITRERREGEGIEKIGMKCGMFRKLGIIFEVEFLMISNFI